MKRRKYFNPPPGPNYAGWTFVEAKPQPGDPDPATMIEAYPGPPPIEVTCKPQADDPDPATMIDIRPGGPTHQKPIAERNGHAPATNPPKEPRGDAR